MNIRVIADSSSNIFRFDGLDYRTVPLKIIFNGLEYPDVESLNAPALMRRIHESGGSTSTSCPSIGDWMDAMEGADRILCMTISGQLSGAYNAALNAAVEYMDEHPGAQVHVVDSLSTGPEIRLGLEHLKQDIEKGIPFDELPTRLHRYFSEILLRIRARPIDSRSSSSMFAFFSILIMPLSAVRSSHMSLSAGCQSSCRRTVSV